jgi:hypothetical protein
MKLIIAMAIVSNFITSTASHAYLNHQEIVEKFTQRDFSSLIDSASDDNGLDILTVDEVIPRHLQDDLLRYSDKSPLDFSDVQSNVDLRHRDSAVVKQIGPRCSAYGLVAAMENLIGNPEVAKLSQSHLFSGYRKYSSERAVKAALKMNITEYKYWPHERKWIPKKGYKKNSHTRLTGIEYIKNDVKKAVAALDAGRPVYIGMSVTSSMGRCDAVLDPNSSLTGGGHAVSVSGYGLDESIPGGGYFILKNSWGKNCGDSGYQYMPFNYCMGQGAQYCIMWDVQSVSTKFQQNEVKPDNMPFNPEDLKLEFKKIKKNPLSKAYNLNINISGESTITGQLEKVMINFHKTGNTFLMPKKLDSFSFSIAASSPKLPVTIYYKLWDGTWHIKDYSF